MSYKKSFRKKVLGFSLVEVTIVLALSLVLVGMVSGVYSLRRNTASDVAVKQIVSEIQTVRNDAQKGLGPNPEDIDDFPSGYTIFGQAISFNNNCGGTTKSCMYVFNLAFNPTTNEIYQYGYYKKDLPQNMVFNLINEGTACNTALSCYKKPNETNYYDLKTSPIVSNVNGAPVGVVVRNGTGQMYAFNGATTNPPSRDYANYSDTSRQGSLKLLIASVDSDFTNQNKWDAVTPKYFITIDLSGSNTITVDRK